MLGVCMCWAPYGCNSGRMSSMAIIRTLRAFGGAGEGAGGAGVGGVGVLPYTDVCFGL